MRQPQLLQVPAGLPLRKRLPPRQQDLQLQQHARRLVERRVLVKRRRAAAPRAPEAHARPAENDPFWLVSGVSQAPPPPRLGRERRTDTRSSLARLARYESPVPPPSGSHKPVKSKERPVRRKRKQAKKRIMDPCLATLSNSRRGTKNREAPRRHTRDSENYPTRDPGRKTQAKPPTPAPLKHLQASTQTDSRRSATSPIAISATADHDDGTRGANEAISDPHAEQTTPRATHTLAEAWKRDLTEEGIEPNPGPSRFITKNLGSIGGLPRWEQILLAIRDEHKARPITAIFLQETGIRKVEDFKRKGQGEHLRVRTLRRQPSSSQKTK